MLIVKGPGSTRVRRAPGSIRVGFRPGARPGVDVLGQRAVSSEPSSVGVPLHLRAAPPGSEAQAGSEQNREWTADERPSIRFLFQPPVEDSMWVQMEWSCPPTTPRTTPADKSACILSPCPRIMVWVFISLFTCFLTSSNSPGPSQCVHSHSGNGQSSVLGRTSGCGRCELGCRTHS